MTFAFPSPDGIYQKTARSAVQNSELKPATRLTLYRFTGFLLACADFVLIIAASVTAGIGYHAFILGAVGDVRAFFAIGAESGLLFILAIQSTGCYRTSNCNLRTRDFSEILLVWVLVLLIVMAFLFLLKPEQNYSRGAMLAFGLLGFSLLLSSRISRSLVAERRACTRNSSGPACSRDRRVW